ncbi:MAG: Ku protein [Propionibacteriaceae bacterium]
MRSIWKGSVAFGLVNVPVRVYKATEDHDLDLHQVHDADGGRIRHQRRCEVCGRKVSQEHIDKAYEQGDQTVILTDEDLRTLPEESGREIAVLEFVPSGQIEPIMLENSYYLAPDKEAVKAYTLLRRALEDTELTAVVRFTLRQRTRLGALRVRGDVLVLQRLLWEDEVRSPEFGELDQDVRVSQKERSMAADLVQTLSGDFTPEDYTDEYAEQLEQLVQAKLEQGEAVDTDATLGEGDEGDADVIDLMDALRQSVDRARDRRTEPSAGGAKRSEKNSATKESTAKKSTGKKSTAKKSSPKKASPKKASPKKASPKKAS